MPHLSQTIEIVEILVDGARGYTSTAHPPALIEPEKGSTLPVSGDLAKLWEASGTARIIVQDPPEKVEPEYPSQPATEPEYDAMGITALRELFRHRFPGEKVPKKAALLERLKGG